MSQADTLPLVAASDAGDDALYRRIAWRIMPILFLGYIIAYLDRVNVGFAKLQMTGDLHFSDAVYGFGAGIFFIGYFLFEVPSNVILHKVGARVWICRVMVVWGLVSAGTAFVHTPAEFYTARFLLGVAEAGFFPGMVLYLTYWFPAHRRGRMMALLMAGNPVSGIVGGPLSGYILDRFAGTQGLAGWQWLFIIEAVPAVILGVVILVVLEDRVATASWFSAEEKRHLATQIERDGAAKTQGSALSIFADPKVWLMCLILFGIVMGSYGFGFWQPTIIRQTGVRSSFAIGLLTTIPYTAALVAMILMGRHADKTRERRWHVIVPCLVAALGFHPMHAGGRQHGRGDNRPVDGGDGDHLGAADVLGTADVVPRRHCGGVRHRLHQLHRQPRRLRQPIGHRLSQDAHRHAGLRPVPHGGNARRLRPAHPHAGAGARHRSIGEHPHGSKTAHVVQGLAASAAGAGIGSLGAAQAQEVKWSTGTERPKVAAPRGRRR